MKPKFQRMKQPTPEALTDDLLEFVRVKFYRDEAVPFAKDRKRLLHWVVLWPASWLNARGVTIHGEAYKQIFIKVMIQADAHRSERIKYRPAWLKMVLQSHFKMHGDEYYEEAKSVRAVVEQTMLLVGHKPATASDPVRDMALARKLMTGSKPKPRPVLKTGSKCSVNLELNLA